MGGKTYTELLWRIRKAHYDMLLEIEARAAYDLAMRKALSDGTHPLSAEQLSDDEFDAEIREFER